MQHAIRQVISTYSVYIYISGSTPARCGEALLQRLHNEHRLRYSSSALLHYDLLAMAPLNSRGSNFAKGGWFISFHCNYFGCLSLSFHSFINIHPGIHSIVFYWWAIQCTIPKGWEIAVEPLLTISRTPANCCVFISSAVPPVKSSAPHQPHRSTPHTNQTSNPNTMMIILTTLYTRNLWEVDLYNAVITVICARLKKLCAALF